MPAPISPLQDKESFSKLFSHTHLIIFRFIYGLYGGPVEEIEDLTSEVYMRAWRGRGEFFGDDQSALNWLFTIARHLVIDKYRKKQNHPAEIIQSMDELDIDAIYDSKQLSPEERVIRREQYLHLWKTLQFLPFERREMLVLRYMVGWQVKQIATFLEMEENTVSVYIHRSVEQIRRDWAIP